jgi:hypothetical protein
LIRFFHRNYYFSLPKCLKTNIYFIIYSLKGGKMVDASSIMSAGAPNIISVPLEWVIVLSILVIWKFVWYGIALFKAIERKQIVWFVVLLTGALLWGDLGLLFGDLGLLAIVYLLLFKEKDKPKKEAKRAAKKKR